MQKPVSAVKWKRLIAREWRTLCTRGEEGDFRIANRSRKPPSSRVWRRIPTRQGVVKTHPTDPTRRWWWNCWCHLRPRLAVADPTVENLLPPIRGELLSPQCATVSVFLFFFFFQKIGIRNLYFNLKVAMKYINNKSVLNLNIQCLKIFSHEFSLFYVKDR